MKAYRDVFGNPLTKVDVKSVTQFVVATGQCSPTLLVRQYKFGYSKAIRLLGVLQDAKVINSQRVVILKDIDGAINAALRQLKKGKKS